MKVTAILQRLFLLVIVLIGVTLVVFSMMHLTPGDPVELMMSQAGHVTEEEVQQLREEYGLDLPLHRQYGRFLAGAVRGDLGTSFTYNRPVALVIATHLPATVELTALALFLAVLLALPVGVICAVRRNSALDWTAIGGSLLGVSIPGFWLGIILMLIFAMKLEWFPVTGRLAHDLIFEPRTGLYLLDGILQNNGAVFWSALGHLALPAMLPPSLRRRTLDRFPASSASVTFLRAPPQRHPGDDGGPLCSTWIPPFLPMYHFEGVRFTPSKNGPAVQRARLRRTGRCTLPPLATPRSRARPARAEQRRLAGCVE